MFSPEKFTPSQTSQRTKQIALLAIFSALYIVLRFIPFSLLIGATGGYLSFSDFLAPIIGILLGPYLGGLTVLIGNFGAIGFGRATNFPTLFGLGDFVPDFVAVVSVGFLMRRKWLPVVALNAGLLALFFVDPLTSIFVTVPGTSISIPIRLDAYRRIRGVAFTVVAKSGKMGRVRHQKNRCGNGCFSVYWNNDAAPCRKHTV